MSLVADLLLGAAAFGAAAYCAILSRRLRSLTGLESGLGGAIAVLSSQVDEMTRALSRAQIAAKNSSATLAEQTQRAEKAMRRLEVLLAALHDLPEEGEDARPLSRSGAEFPRNGSTSRRVVRRRSPQAEPEDFVA